MASIQDINTRLLVLEDKIGWLMEKIPVQHYVPTGMLAPNGQPTVKVVVKTLAEVYREAHSAQLEESAQTVARDYAARTGHDSSAGGAGRSEAGNGDAETFEAFRARLRDSVPDPA